MSKKPKKKVARRPRQKKADPLLEKMRVLVDQQRAEADSIPYPQKQEEKPFVVVPVGAVATLFRCPPGTRFKVIDSWLTGILLMVNQCRARVLLDAIPAKTVFVPPNGKAALVSPSQMHESDWSPQVLVEVTEAATKEFDPATARAKTAKEIKAAKPPKPVKPPVQKDKYGYREGTSCAAINAVLSENMQTLKKVEKLSGANPGLIRSHMRSMQAKGFVLYNKDLQTVKTTGKLAEAQVPAAKAAKQSEAKQPPEQTKETKQPKAEPEQWFSIQLPKKKKKRRK